MRYGKILGDPATLGDTARLTIFKPVKLDVESATSIRQPSNFTATSPKRPNRRALWPISSSPG
jgi:hypothetical protein